MTKLDKNEKLFIRIADIIYRINSEVDTTVFTTMFSTLFAYCYSLCLLNDVEGEDMTAFFTAISELADKPRGYYEDSRKSHYGSKERVVDKLAFDVSAEISRYCVIA